MHNINYDSCRLFCIFIYYSNIFKHIDFNINVCFTNRYRNIYLSNNDFNISELLSFELETEDYYDNAAVTSNDSVLRDEDEIKITNPFEHSLFLNTGSDILLKAANLSISELEKYYYLKTLDFLHSDQVFLFKS